MATFQVLLAASILYLAFPSPVLAFGPQWITTGSYVHQIAHLLFAGAMAFFLRQIHRENLLKYKGFRYLSWAAWFFILWNLDAVVGHFSEWALVNPVILGGGWDKRLLMYDANSWLYYITQINHFVLLAPAFYFFYRGLKTFAQEARP
ncbi:MAG: hypothetical protein FJ126_09495 [Deltaproteobacteria bacterium]|nr:hypothetical protein [Deltaproteobacteria bacterium]